MIIKYTFKMYVQDAYVCVFVYLVQVYTHTVRANSYGLVTVTTYIYTCIQSLVFIFFFFM